MANSSKLLKAKQFMRALRRQRKLSELRKQEFIQSATAVKNDSSDYFDEDLPASESSSVSSKLESYMRKRLRRLQRTRK